MDLHWTEALRIAAEQHSVLHRDQARAAGIPDDRFRRAAAAGLTTSLQRSVVLAPGAQRTFLATAAACVLEVGRRVALTGETALYLHGVIEEPPTHVQLVVPSSRRRPAVSDADDIVRTRTLRAADVVEVRGLPTTRLAWALLHLGRRASQRRVVALAIRAAQRGLLRLEELDDVLSRCGRASGRAHLRAAYEQLAGDTVDSSFELDVRRALRRAGLTPHPAPFPFRCRDGTVLHLDIAFPGAWVGIECDTPGTHGDPDHLDRDRRRWNRLMASGWRLIWATPERLRDDEAGLVAQTRGALAAADPDRAPATATPCGRPRCLPCQRLIDPPPEG